MPQSSQNADEGAFSAPHFGQRLGSGLPHAAQNFLLVVLSVPHLVQRIALPGKPSDSPILYHPAPGRGSELRAQLDRGDQYSELHHKFAGPEMLEFLAMPERLIGGVRRGRLPPGIAPPPHGPEPEPLSLPVSRYFIDGREKGETQRVQTSAVAHAQDCLKR